MKNNRISTIRKSKWFWIKLMVLFAVCLFGFLYSLYYVNVYDLINHGESPDESNYIAMAIRLLEDGVYSFWGEGPDAYVSPGYPMFLVFCMTIFGTGLDAIYSIKIVQCIMVGLSVLLVYLLGYMLTKRYSVGIIAAVFVALNGSFPFYARYLLTETSFTFFMLLFFVAFVYTYQSGKWWMYFISGMLLCVSMMIRPLIIVILPILFLFEVMHRKKSPKILLCAALPFLCGFLLVGLPWWIRNIITLGDFIFLATQTNPIYAGLAQDVVGMGLTDPGSLVGNLKLLIDLFLEHPYVTFYWMTLGKFSIIFLDGTVCQFYPELTKLMNFATVCIGLCGCIRALFCKNLRIPAIIFFVYFLSVFMFVPVQRYALSYLPLLAIGAGYLLQVAFSGVKICHHGLD